MRQALKTGGNGKWLVGILYTPDHTNEDIKSVENASVTYNDGTKITIQMFACSDEHDVAKAAADIASFVQQECTHIDTYR